MGVFCMTSIARANPWTGPAVLWQTIYMAVTISFNILVTLGIVYRLVSMRRSVHQIYPLNEAKLYTSIIAMVVESAALYTVTYLAYYICFLTGRPFQRAILPILVQVMVRL